MTAAEKFAFQIRLAGSLTKTGWKFVGYYARPKWNISWHWKEILDNLVPQNTII